MVKLYPQILAECGSYLVVEYDPSDKLKCHFGLMKNEISNSDFGSMSLIEVGSIACVREVVQGVCAVP